MKSLAKRLVRSCGYDIIKSAPPVQLAKLADDVPHETIKPFATYAPWLNEREFMPFYEGIIIFDDYGFHGCEGVTRMVNDIQEPNGTIIYNLNGHAIVIKSSGK